MDADSISMIGAFKADGYRWGTLQSIPYDKTKTAIFPEGFLGDLYFKLKGDRFHKTRPGNGILEMLFCGMTDLSYDKIVAYMASIPLCIMGEWEGATFKPMGLHFIPTRTGVGAESMCFAGYGFLKEFWGTDEQETLTVLGISQIFGELGVRSIHGIRYTANQFTAQYMARFGFKDLCIIPDYMMRKDKMVAGVVSTLSRARFEQHLIDRVLASTK